MKMIRIFILSIFIFCHLGNTISWGEEEPLPNNMANNSANNLAVSPHLIAALKRYVKFYEEQILCKDTSPNLSKDQEIEIQNSIIRYAQTFSEIISLLDVDAFNEFILFLTIQYFEKPHERDAIQILSDQIYLILEEQFQMQENHHCVKAFGQGGIEGFYWLATLEVGLSIYQKSKLTQRGLQGLGKVFQAFYARFIRLSKSRTLVLVSDEAFLKSSQWVIYLKDLMGKTPRQRLIRFLTAGASIGVITEGYIYHVKNQKINPKLLFEKIKLWMALDLALRVYDFKEVIQKEYEQFQNKMLNSLDFESRFLEYKKSISQFTLEMEHFKNKDPRFWANLELDPEFLDAFCESFPKLELLVKQSLKKIEGDVRSQKISHISLAPLEEELGETALMLLKMEAQYQKK